MCKRLLSILSKVRNRILQDRYNVFIVIQLSSMVFMGILKIFTNIPARALSERFVTSFVTIIFHFILQKIWKKGVIGLVAFFCYFVPIGISVGTKDWNFVTSGWFLVNPSISFLCTGNIHLFLFHAISFGIIPWILKPTLDQLCYPDLPDKAQFTVIDCMFSIYIFTFTNWWFYRIHEATKKKLEEAKIEAEKSSNQLKLFIQSFSHELRNPLNSLLGNLELASSEPNIPSEIERYLKTCKVCTSQLLQLINNILDSGKEEVGNLEIDLKPTEVRGLVSQVWEISRQQIQQKGLRGSIHLDNLIPSYLNLDGMRLIQVLTNLIGNAMKFTRSGEIKITIDWYPGKTDVSEKSLYYDEEFDSLIGGQQIQTDESGSFEILDEYPSFYSSYNNQILNNQNKYEQLNFNKLKFFIPQCQIQEVQQGVLKIQVRDTGEGMTEQNLLKLFEKFNQFSKDTSTRNMGTGLGLFISKKIIDRFQGKIEVKSREGFGTNFICCIPTVFKPLFESSNSSSSFKQQNNIMPPFGMIKSSTGSTKPSFLIVDDSSFNVNLLEKYVLKLGGEVIGKACNGQEALDIYKSACPKPDFILTDIDMPIMNGNDFCRQVREYEKTIYINKKDYSKIIIISGNSKSAELKDEWYNEYFMKPMSYDSFEMATHRLRRQQRRS